MMYNFSLKFVQFQGIYRFINESFNDDFFPVNVKAQFFLEFRVVVRVQGSRKNMKAGVVQYIFEYLPNQSSTENKTSALDIFFKKALS